MIRVCDRNGCEEPLGVGKVDHVLGRVATFNERGEVTGHRDYPVVCDGCGKELLQLTSDATRRVTVEFLLREKLS